LQLDREPSRQREDNEGEPASVEPDDVAPFEKLAVQVPPPVPHVVDNVAAQRAGSPELDRLNWTPS